jgi:hypothetical protein
MSFEGCNRTSFALASMVRALLQDLVGDLESLFVLLVLVLDLEKDSSALSSARRALYSRGAP